MNQVQSITQEFDRQFHGEPELIVRAPGRVNLIGEHTDYNDGFVLPMAIDRWIWIALRDRMDNLIRCFSSDFREYQEFEIGELKAEGSGWVEYLKGVAWVLEDVGYPLRGWEGIVMGNVPIDAGLSSSAALEIAVLRAFSAISDFVWDPKEMAKLGQRVENEWVGVSSGIMDQLVSTSGKAGHALLIDCRTLEIEAILMPEDADVIVLDTSTRRGLVDSAYNERRAQCNDAALTLNVPALRDVDMDMFESKAMELDELTRKRARHVVSENERTLQAAEALRIGDTLSFGELMNASHESLREDFEVSSEELDIMVDLARAQHGCFGARMTGAGFGGCAVALVQSGEVVRFSKQVARSYKQRTGLSARVYRCVASEGASIITLEDA
ncbi:MAG: galactokinase [Anaerolineales bacterium]|nr:galactokinase [Anaerolineales bacterium]